MHIVLCRVTRTTEEALALLKMVGRNEHSTLDLASPFVSGPLSPEPVRAVSII